MVNVESTCRYYENGTCVVGGQKNNCSANPNECENCFVWKLHAQGDLSEIY